MTIVVWDVVASISTAVAASVTAWMAYETRKVAVATRRAAEVSNRSLDQQRNELEELSQQTEAMRLQAKVGEAALRKADIPILLVKPGMDPRDSSEPLRTTPYAVRDGAMSSTALDPDIRGSVIIQPSQAPESLWIVIEVLNVGPGLAIVMPPKVDHSPGAVGGSFSLVAGVPIDSQGNNRLQPQIPAIPSGAGTTFVARLDDPGDWFRDAVGTLATDQANYVSIELVYQDLTRNCRYQVEVVCGISFQTSRSSERPNWFCLHPGMPTYLGY